MAEQVRNGPPGLELWAALSERPTIYLPVNSVGATAKLVRGTGILIGCAIKDDAQGAGAFTLIDGEDATGQLMASVSWAAAGFGELSIGDFGPMFRNGLLFTRVAGTLSGAVWVKI